MIKSLSVVGGGTAGLVTALILKKRFEQVDVQVIRSNSIGIIGVGEGSTEHWREFMEFLGITPWEIIQACDATLKCGIMFQNWGEKDYLHSIQDRYDTRKGQYPLVLGKILSENGDTENMSSRLFWQNKVNRWFTDNPDYCPTNQFHFNTNKLNQFLCNLCDKFGISLIDDEIEDVEIAQNIGIKKIIGKKSHYESDFYIDSTGFRRILIGKLGAEWKSYKDFLKMKKAIVFPTQDNVDYNMWTTARALKYGWMFRIPVYGRHGNGYIFDSDYITADQAKEELDEIFNRDVEIAKTITFDPGCLDKVWIKNCVAVGLSANFVEPLEASSIGTSIQQAFLLMVRLPNYDDNTINDYNRDIDSIMKNIRDFIFLHYITKKTDSDFWTDMAANEIPDSLNDKLERWRKKLPVVEDFNKDSRYILFQELHHIFILAGLGILDREYIKQEYEMLSTTLKVEADQIVNELRLHDDTVSLITHKEYLDHIRNA